MSVVTSFHSDFGSDRGAVSVLSIALIAIALSLLTLGGAVGAWTLDRAQAGMVADLAALAASRSGSCGLADHVAELHSALLVECSTIGPDVVVEVRIPRPNRWLPDVTHRSRAGY